MNKHIVRLKYNEDQLSGYQLDENSAEVNCLDNESETETPTNEVEETWLIVPGYDVLVTLLPAPQRLRHKQFSQSVPFILEEKLGEDIESLHFVTAKNRYKDKWPVAVVKKLLIDRWLELAKSLRNPLTAILPDFILLPYTQNQWTVYFDENYALVRMGEYHGFSVEKDMLFDVIYAYLVDETHEKPEVIKFLNFKLPNKLDEVKLAPHNIIAEYEEISDAHHLIKSAFSIKNVPLNLLQGPYQVSRKNNKKLYYAMIAGIVVTTLFGIVITKNLVNYYSYKQQLHVVSQQIEDLKTDIYPNAELSSDMRSMMQTELTSLRQQQQQNQFLSLLYLSGEPLKNRDQIKVEAIEYRNISIALTLELKSFELLDQLTKDLQKKGLMVKREYARSENNVVKARLIIGRSNT